MADRDSSSLLDVAAVEIRGTVHAELPGLGSLFPTFSLGQKMFADKAGVSPHSGGSGQLLRALGLAGSAQAVPGLGQLSTGGLSWAA